MACTSGFSIDMSTVAQSAGNYRIEIVADGQTFTCEQSLPFASCHQPVNCQWHAAGYSGIAVTMSGCALPPAQHSMSGIEFNGVCPAHVSARIYLGERVIGQWESDVDYRRVVANGEHCGPVCAQGNFATRPTMRP